MAGATRVKQLPSKQFCRQNFVFGRASEAGLGNEMYKILIVVALSLLLNQSLIICKQRLVIFYKVHNSKYKNVIGFKLKLIFLHANWSMQYETKYIYENFSIYSQQCKDISTTKEKQGAFIIENNK